MPCPFCEGIDERMITAAGSAVALLDGFPVTEGHTLIVPRRHVADAFELTDQEWQDILQLLKRTQEDLRRGDPRIDGFNVGINCGSSAGQTVPHVHVHLIPRRSGDVEDPRGGVRGVVPERMKY
jgi:diadenosine tetraphosphate (Ap4A) HIT family hydrolase